MVRFHTRAAGTQCAAPNLGFLVALIFCAVACFSFGYSEPAYGQTPVFSTPQWVARYNGTASGREDGAKVATDRSGNVYVTTASMGAGSDMDIVTIKYDASGVPVWTQRFNGDGNYIDEPVAIAVDPQGSIVVAGYSWRGFFYNGGTEYDYTTLKYAPDGTLLWVRYYNGPSITTSIDLPHAMDLDAAGNIVVTGYSCNQNPRGGVVNEYATVKYDPAGSQLWARRYHAPDFLGDGAEVVKFDANGNVAVSGAITVYRGGQTDDVVTIKYDANGNTLWTQQYNGSGSPLYDSETALAMGFDAQGSLYVCGYTTPAALTYRLFLNKYSASGQLLWTRIWGADPNTAIPAKMCVTPQGDCYVACETEKHDPINGADIETVRWDANGSLVWDHIWDSPLPDFDENPQIAMDALGNVYVSSWSSNLPDTGWDFTINKYLPDGTSGGVIRYDYSNASSDLVFSMAVDVNGNLVVAGNTSVGGTPYDLLVARFAMTEFKAPPPAPDLSSLVLSPSTVVGGSPVIGTVTITQPAPVGGYAVGLGNDSGVVIIPASVLVPAGASSASFTIRTVAVPTSQVANIIATFAGTARSAVLTVAPASAPAPTLQSLTVSPSSVTGGSSVTGTVALSAPAPSGGAIVPLSSSSTFAGVPASVTVPAGASSATVGISTKAVTAATFATITGVYAGISRSASLAINPAVVADKVSITRADYVVSKKQLQVEAASTNSTAVLKVYVSSTGALIGTLTNNGGGKYSGTFASPANPVNITVKSSLGGSASKTVTPK